MSSRENRIIEQIELMRRDLNDEDSNLYGLLFSISGLPKEQFQLEMEDRIREANDSSSLFRDDHTVYCASKNIDGKQVYFKFSAPEEEMEKAVGSSAPYLSFYPGSITLSELGSDILIKYVMPYYYLEFGSFSKELQDHPMVKNWMFFTVTID